MDGPDKALMRAKKYMRSALNKIDENGIDQADTADQSMRILDILRDLEATCFMLRMVSFQWGCHEENEYFHMHHELWKELKCSCRVEGEIVVLELPPLRPEKNRLSGQGRKVIGTGVREFLKTSLTSELVSMRNRTNCTVVFEHVRDKGTTYFDYDNLEFKVYLDAVADLFLCGDSCQDINLFQCCRTAEKNLTVVYVIPNAIFPAWTARRIN